MSFAPGKVAVNVGNFAIFARNTAKLSFIDVDAVELEFGVLDHVNTVPPNPEIGIPFEPFAEQVSERFCFHFTSEIVAETTGRNDVVFIRFATIDPGEEVVFGGSIRWGGYPVCVVVTRHAMLTVKARIMLRRHNRIEVRHGVLQKRTLTLE